LIRLFFFSLSSLLSSLCLSLYKMAAVVVETVSKGEEAKLRLGVLALQGAFVEHAEALHRVAPDAEIITIRNAVR
jgi:hypothetical protein